MAKNKRGNNGSKKQGSYYLIIIGVIVLLIGAVAMLFGRQLVSGGVLLVVGILISVLGLSKHSMHMLKKK